MAAAVAQKVVQSSFRNLPTTLKSGNAVAKVAASVAFAPTVSSPTPSSILQPNQDVVICRWWTGEYVIDPERFIVNGQGNISKDDIHNPKSLLRQEVLEKFEDTGLVHVQNTGLTDMGDQRCLARILMGNETEYEGGANPRGRTSDLANVYDIGAPLEAGLHYHHEMTYKSHSVKTLGFLCKHAVQRGDVGWSFVSDSVQAHDYIMNETQLGPKLKDKGLCFIRRMTDAEAPASAHDNGLSTVYNHWQQSWMAESIEEAEMKARTQGLEVEWTHHPNKGRMMETRYYKSAFEYIPSLDRNIMVTSIADDGEWFDSWPVLQDVPQEERPLEMMFGDDTPFTLEEKQLWTDVYDKFGIPLAWQPGDVAVLCNMRYAHGRPGISLQEGEQRELGVMLGEFFERQETQEGKW